MKREKEKWQEERDAFLERIADLNSKIVISNVTAVKNSIAAKDKALSEMELYKDYSKKIIMEKESTIETQIKTLKLANYNLKISKGNLDRAFILMLFLVICASGIHQDFWNNLLYPIYNMSSNPEYIIGAIITVLFSAFIGYCILKKWCYLTIIVLIMSLYYAVLLSGSLSPTGTYGILIGIPTIYLFADLIFDDAEDESIKKRWHHLKMHFIFKPLHKL